MTIYEIIKRNYNKLYHINQDKNNKVISLGRTIEDILNDVCLTAIRKFKTNDITEDEGLSYLKKTLYSEIKFQYARKKNELVIYTDNLANISDNL